MSSRLAALTAASRAKKATAAPASTSAGPGVPSPIPISIIPPKSVPETISIPSDETEGSKVVRGTDKKKKRKEKEREVVDTRPGKKIRITDKPSDVLVQPSDLAPQTGGGDILKDDDLALRVFEDFPIDGPIYQELLDKDIGLYAEIARTEARSVYLAKVLRQALEASFEETKKSKSEVGIMKKVCEDRIMEIKAKCNEEIRSQADSASNALKLARECGESEKLTMNKLRETELESDKLKSEVAKSAAEVAKLSAEVAKSNAEIAELRSRPSEAEVIKSFTGSEAHQDALAAAKLEGEIGTYDECQEMFRKAALRLDPSITEDRLNEAVDAVLAEMEASKTDLPAPQNN